jgi:hypothetical protein
LWPYGALAALLFVVMWPAWTTTSRIVISGDATLIHFPWFQFWRDELSHWRFPFWNPYTFSGFPAFATPQSGFAYPPHWVVSWMPAAMALNWMVGLHVMLAGLSTAWCASKLGANKDGQFLAGAVFALGSGLTARMVAGHLSFIEALGWLPLATGLAVSINERHRPWQLAIVLGVQTLAGQPEVTIFSVWWLLLWAVGINAFSGRREAVAAVLRTALALVLGIGLAAFFVVPVLKLQAISNRAVPMSWDFRTGGSLPLWHVLELINPKIFGNPKDGTYWPGQGFEWHERLLYVGLITFVVALFARGRYAGVCWLAAAVAIGLAFGRYVPWYRLTTGLPGYDDIRIPGKHLAFASLAIALAGGLGLQRLPGRAISIGAIAAAVIVFIASITTRAWLPPLVDLFGGTDGPAAGQSLRPLATNASTPLVIGAILLALLAVLALLPTTTFRRAVLVVAVLEVIFVLAPRIDFARPKDVYGDVQNALPAGSKRAVLNNGALIANYGPVIKSVQPGGYTSLFSGGYQELVTGQRNPGVIIEAGSDSQPFLYLLGYDSTIDRQTALVTVFDPSPREAWVAHCSWPGGAPEARQSGFPLLDCVTRKSAQTREPAQPSAAANVVKRSTGYLKVSASGPGHLITTTPIYPGWSAKIDGKTAATETLDGALLGVELPPGDHTVVFRYRPGGLTLGLVLTALSALALVGVWQWERRWSLVATPERSLEASDRVVADEADGHSEQEAPRDDLGQGAAPQ